MSLDIYDYVMMVVVIFAIVLFAVFNTDVMGKSVSMKNNYSAYYKNRSVNESICTDVNCTLLDKTLKSIAKTVTTTTTSSTIKISFFNTSGSTSALISTRFSNSLVDCGNDVRVMDKVFLSGANDLTYVMITDLDESHAGGCSRLLMDVPFNKVMDSGGSPNGVWFSNYRFIAGNSRVKYPDKTFNLGNVVVYPIKNNDTNVHLVLKIGKTIFGFLGDCNNYGFVNSSKYDLLVCDKPMNEDNILSSKVKYVVVRGSTSEFNDLAAKYGVTVLDTGAGTDFMVSTDGVKINIDRKKGL